MDSAASQDLECSSKRVYTMNSSKGLSKPQSRSKLETNLMKMSSKGHKFLKSNSTKSWDTLIQDRQKERISLLAVRELEIRATLLSLPYSQMFRTT